MFRRGQEVYRCQPFSYVVSQAARPSVCDFCLKSKDDERCALLRCSGCKVVYYCAKAQCQKNAWLTYHKDECMILRKVAPNIPTDTVRLMARIILKLRAGGTKLSDDLPDWPEGQNRRYFDDLLSHQKDIVRDSKRIEAFQSFYVILQKCLGEDKLPPKSDVLDIFGKILINSFNIMSDEYQSIGVGLYLGASVLDHSCEPNAVVIFKGKELIVRTIAQVENVSDLRISYTNILETTTQRRQNLSEQYYFYCDCVKCQDEEKDALKSSLVCKSCQFGCVPASKGVCSKCKTSVEISLLEQHSKLRTELKKALNTEELIEDQECLEMLYQKAAAIFHHQDKDYYDFVEHLYDVRLNKEEYNGCLEVLRIILAHQHLNDSSYSTNKALAEMKAAKLCSYLNKLDEADIHISKAKDNLRVTHGDIHPLSSKYWRHIRQDIDMGKRELKDMSLNYKKIWAKSG